MNQTHTQQLKEVKKMRETEIQAYSFNGVDFPVKGTIEDPLFDASLICELLDYGNTRQAISSHLDSDDVHKLDTIDSMGRTQKKNFINESGLFSLILGSKKPEAKQFKRWVTSDLLPSLRKNGSYGNQPQEPKQIESSFTESMVTDSDIFYRSRRAMGYTAKDARKMTSQFIDQKYGLESNESKPKALQESKGRVCTPTQLGRLLPDGLPTLSGMKINKILVSLGMQEHCDVLKGWKATIKGSKYSFLDNTTSSNGSHDQLKWYESVLPMIAQAYTEEAKAS